MRIATLRASSRAALALLFAVPVLALPTFATPHTPAKGSSERTAIMNALHRVLGSGKHKPLVTIDWFKVERGWAYVTGGFSYADGAPLEEEYTEGPGSHFSALLHKEGKTWRVKTQYSNGDVIDPEIARQFPKAPRAIFQSP